MNLDQHPKRGILKDIDKTALLSMRDSGMTNQEIADSIGCCYATVSRILGKQPPGMRKSRAPKEVKKIQMNTPRKRMKVSHVTLCGKFADFEVDLDNKTFAIETGEGSLIFDLSKLEEMANDLAEALQEVKEYRKAG